MMKTLPSELFKGCQFTGDEDAGFYDVIPEGFDHVISLYLGSETVKDDAAIAKAGAFFDRAPEWDQLCRQAFETAAPDSEDREMVMEYFDFYKDEVPEVFDVEDASGLSLSDMIKSLTFSHMGTHGAGPEQSFNVDFTLGYDQLLCAYFDSNMELDHIAWES